MKVSTKFRLKYLALFAVLLLGGHLSLSVFGNPGVFLGVAVFVLFIGQLIILGTSSDAQCPNCRAYIFNMENKQSNYTMGYQSAIFSLLLGRCSSCKSKL
jgi:hypothetical protein